MFASDGVQNIQADQKTGSTNQRLAWTELDVSLCPVLLKPGIIVLFQKPSPAIETHEHFPRGRKLSNHKGK